MKLGHPADCNSKNETVQAKKERDNKNQERGLTNPQPKQKNDCLFKINHQYPNHHRKIGAKTQTRSNV